MVLQRTIQPAQFLTRTQFRYFHLVLLKLDHLTWLIKV